MQTRYKSIHRKIRLLWALTGSLTKAHKISGIHTATLRKWKKLYRWDDFKAELELEMKHGSTLKKHLYAAAKQGPMIERGESVHKDEPEISEELCAAIRDLQDNRTSGQWTEDGQQILTGLGSDEEDGEAPDVDYPDEVLASEDVVDRAIEQLVTDSQAINDAHFELYEAVRALLKQRLGIHDGKMEDPGRKMLPDGDIRVVLQSIQIIQDGQRKAMGIDQQRSDGHDFVVEYTSLRNQLDETADRVSIKGSSRPEVLDFARDLLRKHGVDAEIQLKDASLQSSVPDGQSTVTDAPGGTIVAGDSGQSGSQGQSYAHSAHNVDRGGQKDGVISPDSEGLMTPVSIVDGVDGRGGQKGGGVAVSTETNTEKSRLLSEAINLSRDEKKK